MAFDYNFLTGSPLLDMGNGAANNSPFGENSQFYTVTCEKVTPDEIYKGVTDYEKLVTFLRTATNKRFDWRTYQSNSTKTTLVVADDVGEYDLPVNIPFNYDLFGEKKQGAFGLALLNKRNCYLNAVPSLEMVIDPKESSPKFAVHYYYADAFKNFVPDSNSNDEIFTAVPHPNYKAIDLITSDAEVFYGFLNRLDYVEAEKIITQKFNAAYQQLDKKNTADINWFYTHAPAFVVNQIPIENLWQDLKILLQYDVSKWFIDNSNNMIKVIQAIINQDTKKTFLYTRFFNNPQFIKDVYAALDKTQSSSLHNGEAVPNKSIFASLLLAITYDYHLKTKKPFTTSASFVIDEEHRVDSNIISNDSNEQDKYDLTQQTKTTTTTQKTTPSTYNNDYSTNQVESSVKWENGTTHSLHPLELVNVTLSSDGQEPLTVPMPAIMVKDMSYHREWGEIMKVVAIAGDVLAIVFGLATLGTGNPLFLALALADIGLAGFDLYVQITENEHMKTEEGRIFLADWQRVSIIGGLALAATSLPQLLKSMLDSGADLLKTAAKVGSKATDPVKNFLKQALVSIILEMNIATVANSSFKSVEIGVDIFKTAPVKLSTKALGRLDEKGVIFAKLEQADGSTSYAAFHKGEQIVPNSSPSDFKQAIDPLVGKVGDDLVEALEELGYNAIQRKLEKRARKFVHEMNQKSASLANLTAKEMSAAIRGYTSNVDEIADVIEKGRIFIDIWDDVDFIDYLVDYAKKRLSMNNAEALDYAWSTEAFTDRKKMVFKESTNPERFLTQLVHEGTHALDNLKIEILLQKGKN